VPHQRSPSTDFNICPKIESSGAKKTSSSLGPSETDKLFVTDPRNDAAAEVRSTVETPRGANSDH